MRTRLGEVGTDEAGSGLAGALAVFVLLVVRLPPANRFHKNKLRVMTRVMMTTCTSSHRLVGLFCMMAPR
jgi:hypothetical protein